MKNRIDSILLGLLWLLAVTLGASFWFNTNYGFNIFSAPHWQYLAYLQAAQMPVKTGFYISLAAAVFVAILGLYILVRPRFKKIRLPIIKLRKHAKTDGGNAKTQTNVVAAPPPPATATDTTQSVVVLPPAQSPAKTNSDVATQPRPMPSSARPPRLHLPTMSGSHISTPPAPTLTEAPIAPLAAPIPSQDQPEIRNIFERAGYTVKKNIKIAGVPTALIAIGTNETLWIGSVGVKTSDLRRAMDYLSQVFSDTLDDIYIGINGFVISAPDAATSEFQDILMFNTTTELGKYMASHKNPPVPSDDQGNFDAYSEYIDTVINYVGKL